MARIRGTGATSMRVHQARETLLAENAPRGGETLTSARTSRALLVLAGLLAAGRLGAQFSFFETGTPGASPASICRGPDGNIWYTLGGSVNRLGRITSSGSVAEFPVPTPNTDPGEITAGADGNLWFVEGVAHQIGRSSTSGSISEFHVPGDTRPFSITSGPDGSLWLSDIFNAVWRVSVSGSLTRFPVAGGSYGIAAGGDGNLWFTSASRSSLGRITPGGETAFFPLPGTDSPGAIAPGPDGKMWFTVFGRSFGRISAAGTLATFPFASPHGRVATSIAVGPDGNLWMPVDEISVCSLGFCTTSVDGVLRVAPDGQQTYFELPSNLSITELSRIAAGPDGSLWMTASGGFIRFYPSQLTPAASGPLPALGPIGYLALFSALTAAALWRLRR